MTHIITTGDPAVTDAASFLARHAAARVWRHLAEDPETTDAARTVLLEHLPGIEADPVGADWEAASRTVTNLAVYYSAIDAAAGADYCATANSTRAVGLGCVGSDRIGLALTLTLLAEAEAEAEATTRPDPTNAWELAGMVIEDGH